MPEGSSRQRWAFGGAGQPSASERLSLRSFAYRVLIAVGLTGAAYLLWQLKDVLMLAFAGLLLAVLLRSVSDPIARRTGLSDGWALALTAAVLAAALAASLYRRGLLRLLPRSGGPDAEEAMDAASGALRKWLLGKLVSMLLVGILTTTGLWLLGVPLALSLGVLAGALEFVPFIGPVVAAVPGILFAFTQSPSTALYVALLYLGIQQVESYLIMPLVQRWAVALPPALAILAVVGFGVLFGVLGLLFAVPLMVLVMVLVEKLYVETALGQPGQHSSIQETPQ